MGRESIGGHWKIVPLDIDFGASGKPEKDEEKGLSDFECLLSLIFLYFIFSSLDSD